MAKQKKIPKKLEKPIKKEKITISRLAQEAAQLAVDQSNQEIVDDENPDNENPDQIDMEAADLAFDQESPENLIQRDVFVDAFRKAQSKGDMVRFYVYKNSQFTTIKTHPYSWQQLQKEFGEGHYRIIAKSVKNGQNVMVQSELVGDPNPLKPEEDITESVVKPQSFQGQVDPLALFSLLAQTQERADTKAGAAAQSGSAMQTAMIQAIVQSQSQSAQQFQTLLVEMQKQTTQAQQQANQQMMNLFTTLLTQKKSDDGFTAASVMKMVEDARRDTKSDMKDWFKTAEEKADKIIEEREDSKGDDKPESLTQTIIKGFVPLLGQMAASQSQQQPTPEQIAAMQPPVQAPGTRTPEQIALLKAEHESRVRQQNAARELQARQKKVIHNPEVVNVQMPAAGGGDLRSLNRASEASSFPRAKPVQAAQPAKNVADASKGEHMNGNAEPIRRKMFDLVKMEIGTALLTRGLALKCADSCLKILESHNFPRQTVKEILSLDDVLRYAKESGIPDAAKPWFQEFYGSIEKLVPSAPARAGTGVQPGATA